MRFLHDERGAVSILVGLLISAGVILGLLALVIDGGRLYSERRVLQNGADAAALAVARACATGDPACSTRTAATSLGGSLANQNAGKDQVSALDEACGSGNLGACRALRSHAWECQSVAGNTNFVRIRTTTRETDGASIIPGVFSASLGFDGKGMWACSQAIWGAARAANVTFPIALSACDYVSNASTTIEIFSPPSYKPGQGPRCTVTDKDGVQRVLQDMVKGFFYVQLDATRKDCLTPVRVNVGDILPRADNIVQLCGTDYESAFRSFIGVQTPLPIFDAMPSGGGIGTTTMRISSFVAFTLRAYRLAGNRTFGSPPGGWPSGCRGSNRCLYGDFGSAVTGDTGVIPGTPNFGLQSIQLIP
jgi:hypothetical protein